ncbi:carbohydrate kinase family protein [Candidatus Babeliales bacterium]|nr:carbohydrate kinase family protein [Candidatus Babeliales bacterium]
MKKILTIGGATQDIFLHYEGADFMSITKKNNVEYYMLFESGEKIEVDDILYTTGGGAANSAVSFKRLGFDATCFCKIGTDNTGNFILKELEKENINTKFITKTDKIISGRSFIIHSIRRERTIFAYRGANGFLQESELPIEQIKNSDQLYITSLSYDSAKLLPKIVKTAKQANVPVAINPGVSQLSNGTLNLKESLKDIDIFILNSSEAQKFMLALVLADQSYQKALESQEKKKTPLKHDEIQREPYLLQTPFLCENFYFSTRKFFKEILKMGPKTVVITNGENGVYVANKDSIFFHPSIKTEVIDTLGAGDSFGSCFVASLNLGYSIKESLRNGIINSSSVIQQIGAKPGLLTHEQLKEKIKNFKQDLIQELSF